MRTTLRDLADWLATTGAVIDQLCYVDGEYIVTMSIPSKPWVKVGIRHRLLEQAIDVASRSIDKALDQ